ncbi:MFS transporter [Sphingomonas arantia]|uniref:MFS transporter n=1 Tax=Sphingomonas arantia TaxID=1460676 RepID=A0ABW4TZS9_9SPHN
MPIDISRKSIGPTVICLLIAAMEGYDLQSAGIVAPRLARHFLLRPDQLGWVFSAGTAGLFLGAVLGGRISDRVGRKAGLIASALLFGMFSIGSGVADNFELLVTMRLLTGIGLGSALPNIVGLVIESSAPGTGAARVTKIAACMPVGGAIASLLALKYPALGWQGIFYVGGIVPILLAIAAMGVLPATPPTPLDTGRSFTVPARGGGHLLGRDNWLRSIALWTISFCVLLILYVLLNWLPILMEAKGAAASTALLAAMGFALAGAAGGAVFGHLLGRAAKPTVLALAHGGMFISFLVVAVVNGSTSTLIAVSATGFFIAGAQALLYGVSGETYEASIRGRGVGTAVAVGRLGGIAGPALAAAILTRGASANTVILSLLPVVLVSLAAVFVLGQHSRSR